MGIDWQGLVRMQAHHSITHKRRKKLTINAEASSLATASLLSAALMTTKQSYFRARKGGTEKGRVSLTGVTHKINLKRVQFTTQHNLKHHMSTDPMIS